MKRFTILIITTFYTLSAMAWGQKGHDIVAYVAENHLTAEAAECLDEVLDGHSLVYYSSWADNVRYTPEFAHTTTWHYFNIDEGNTIDTQERNPEGDAQTAVEHLIKELKSGKLSKKDESDAVKLLIHFIGDIHCPMHLGRSADLGGNKRPVTYFGRQTNLHSIWDTPIIESAHKWSYSEWQDQIDRKGEDEIVAIQASTPRDWVIELHPITEEIYESTPEGARLSYDYVTKYTPILEEQLVRAGYRLAAVLNDIYN